MASRLFYLFIIAIFLNIKECRIEAVAWFVNLTTHNLLLCTSPACPD